MIKNLLPLIVWPIVASLISFLVRADVMVSMLLFLGAPAAYLSIRKPSCIKMAAIFSAIASVPLAIIIDYVMELTGGWFLPYSIFGNFRLFGYVSIEQLIWLFLYFYLVAMFYENFLDEHCTHQLFGPAVKYFAGILFAPFGLFLVVLFTKPELLNIHYFYLKIGFVLVLPMIILILFKFPNFYAKFFWAGIYFFFLSLIYEITALLLGQWTFPAKHQLIGYVNLGIVEFPLEEFVFWITLGAVGVAFYYALLHKKLK
ncbi:MAG: hypothetical protein UT37_C0011G0012 [Parcubacteria group bacterium GW2011_GWA2_39_18]|nr:MAG: hypothetical protein UT37_C0011G0012 [Parcubacteria group bacterium GW2011_GWA2_39_18]